MIAISLTFPPKTIDIPIIRAYRIVENDYHHHSSILFVEGEYKMIQSNGFQTTLTYEDTFAEQTNEKQTYTFSFTTKNQFMSDTMDLENTRNFRPYSCDIFTLNNTGQNLPLLSLHLSKDWETEPLMKILLSEFVQQIRGEIDEKS